MISILGPLFKRGRDKTIEMVRGADVRHVLNFKTLRGLRLVPKALIVLVGIAFVFSAHYSLAYYNINALELVYGRSIFIDIPDTNENDIDTAIQKPSTVSYVVGGNSFFSISPVPIVEPEPEYVVEKTVRIPITAYSSTPGQTDASPFITASGSHVRDGIVAANFLPIGTEVKIPELYGDKVFVVEDRMNGRYWYKMDIWMKTYPEAKNFGLKYAEVTVVTKI